MQLGRRRTRKPEGRQPVSSEGRAPVYAYRSLRDERGSNEPRLAQGVVRKTKSALRLIIRRITVILCLLVLLFGLWLRPAPNVTIIRLPATIHRKQAYYDAEIARLWSKQFTNQSKLTIRADKLSREMLALFPELADARVELPLLGQLPNVILTPGTPVLLLVTQKGAFYVDANGKTMVRSDLVEVSELGSIPTVRDDTGIVPEPGRPALPLAQMETVIALVHLCQAAQLELETVSLPTVPNEVDMVAKGTKYTVKFALDQDPKQGIGALLALRDKFSREGITPASYLDLRVPDKAFYK